jgi:uncharacterized integral membrane protein (TIGR00698 family)
MNAPGLVVAAAIAVSAKVVSDALPVVLGSTALALLFGALLRSVLARSARLAPGAAWASQRLLRAGIVLLGAHVSFELIGELGVVPLVLVISTMILAFAATAVAALSSGVPRETSVLLAVGNSVCGNTAIAATAPVIQADVKATALAMATITAFGTAAVVAYPLLGEVMGMAPILFGIWCGIAINDTSQVVAASGAFSPVALQVATVVKFVRNAFLAPVIVGIAWWWGSSGENGSASKMIVKAIPPFVVGFVALAAAGNLGLIDDRLRESLAAVSDWLILGGLAAVGVGTDVRALRHGGGRVAVAGIGSALVVGTAALGAVLATHGLIPPPS